MVFLRVIFDGERGDSHPFLHLKTSNGRAFFLISSEGTLSEKEIAVSYDQIGQYLGGFGGKSVVNIGITT